MFDEDVSVEVLDLMLQADRQQTVGVDRLFLAVEVEVANDDLLGALNLVVDSGNRQTTFLADLDAGRFDQLLVLINPELVESTGTQVCEEGCLSVPGIYDKVERAERVVVRYLDLDGKRQTVAGEGLLAVCLQHEMEHLDGHVFVEHLSQLKQVRIKAKLLKQARITA